MLETIRDYAREKLEQAGELAPTAARHCQHYFALAKAVDSGMEGSEQATWITRIETELDNVRAAIALAMAGGVDPIIAVKFAVAMQGFWILRGYATEGRGVVRAALALPAVRASDHGASVMRCTSAPRWPIVRATMPRRAAMLEQLPRPCAEGSAMRSTSRRRCRRWR